jgi:hypothetical protein
MVLEIDGLSAFGGGRGGGGGGGGADGELRLAEAQKSELT